MFLSHNFFWPLSPSPFHDTLKTLFSSSHPDVGGPQPSLLSSLFCLSAITHPFISTFHLYPVIYTPVLPLPQLTQIINPQFLLLKKEKELHRDVQRSLEPVDGFLTQMCLSGTISPWKCPTKNTVDIRNQPARNSAIFGRGKNCFLQLPFHWLHLT